MNGEVIGAKKRKRPKYEIILVVIVILAAIFVSVNISRAKSGLENGELLLLELQEMRSAVQTYYLLNKANPPDLNNLGEKIYSFAPDEKTRKYISYAKVDKEGQPIDPFGNPYVYNPETGWVWSIMVGYSEW